MGAAALPKLCESGSVAACREPLVSECAATTAGSTCNTEMHKINPIGVQQNRRFPHFTLKQKHKIMYFEDISCKTGL